MRPHALLLFVVLVATGCKKKEVPFAVAGSGGAGGSAGSGGTGGSSGSGGTSGTGGRSGTGGGGSGGNAGSSGTGGRSGSGGTSGTGGRSGSGGGGAGGNSGSGGTTGAECNSASDCKLVGGCCSCEAVPLSGEAALPCQDVCFQGHSHCDVIGVTSATCVAGRCVFDVSCDDALVINPDCRGGGCDPGETQIVRDGCYGACIDARECREHTKCESCKEDETCVRYTTSDVEFRHCVRTQASCNGTSTCECMSAVACGYYFHECSETSDSLTCHCPSC